MTEGIVEFWSERDPRMAEYPLMDSPIKTVIFSAIFLSFIKVIGPAWMRHRKPFELRTLMVLYNAVLVIISSWLFLNFAIYGWFTTYSWRCEPIDNSRNPTALKIVQACWMFYISKLMEYADTVFFVLRKKDSQINFLHVFHHTVVPITAWYGVSYGPGGYNTIFCLLNTFVHIWMYLYYGLSAMGPKVQKYLWWKKYLTTLQLLQFTTIVGFFIQLVIFPKKNCKVSGFLVALSVIQGFVFFGLFLHFYFRSYKGKPLNKYQKVSAMNQKGANGIGKHEKDV